MARTISHSKGKTRKLSDADKKRLGATGSYSETVRPEDGEFLTGVPDYAELTAEEEKRFLHHLEEWDWLLTSEGPHLVELVTLESDLRAARKFSRKAPAGQRGFAIQQTVALSKRVTELTVALGGVPNDRIDQKRKKPPKKGSVEAFLQDEGI